MKLCLMGFHYCFHIVIYHSGNLLPSASSIKPTIKIASRLPKPISSSAAPDNSLNTSASSLSAETRTLTRSNKSAARRLSTEIQPLPESDPTTSSSEHFNAPEFPQCAKRNSRNRRKRPKVQKAEIKIQMWLHIDLEIFNFGQSLESAVRNCEQLMHFRSRVQSVEECPTDAHLEHVSCPWEVKFICIVGKPFESLSIVILLTWVTPLSESPSRISASKVYKRSSSDMTPRQEFNDLFRVSAYSFKSLLYGKGRFVIRDISLLGSNRIKNRECVAIVSMAVVGGDDDHDDCEF
ncbi:hypothetical protein TNCV_3305431 [Trichonephila clavipes]|nr:hypothetical protein TNCV_3305431 [Trichonephila clavipes]